MKTLVTGGAGFIGRELVEHWNLNDSRNLIVLDKQVQNLETLSTAFPGVECVLGDASNLELLSQILSKNQVSRLIHLAANSDIKGGVDSANPDFHNTLKTTVALAEILKFHPVQRVYFASTSAVYGAQNEPISSTKITKKYPESNYGWAKLASEQILWGVSKLRSLPLVIIRFPNVVGPKPTHGILYDFARKLHDSPNLLEVLGDGSQTKPYIHVSDLAKVMLRMFELEAEKNSNQVWECNISPGDVISVSEIVKVVLEITRLNPIVNWGASPRGWEGDIPNYSYEDMLPTEYQDIKIRNSLDAVRDSFQELWYS
jgi:UDP-glucose 4-epimerase